MNIDVFIVASAAVVVVVVVASIFVKMEEGY
jgi:hypothetical protein